MLEEKKNYGELALSSHRDWKGKIEVVSRVKVNDKDDLSTAYTPGVAAPCLEIQKDPDLSYEYTRRWNLCAVITNGTAVLGLGDIGPKAGMPVMEGKCALFKEFADVDAFPICIDSKDVDEIVQTVKLISGSFGGVNLEDIGAPACFEIEDRLRKECDIPIFHDDQHGTAIVTLAGLLNALKIVGKNIEDIKLLINGAGAAATAIAKLLLSLGLKDIVVCDRKGALHDSRTDLNKSKKDLASITNPNNIQGSLSEVIKGVDVFVGVSGPNVLTADMVESMASSPIIFACANPDPEIMPEVAYEAGAAVVATGRSDYPNQINNVLAFPGVFRGAFDVRAKDINDEMKIAAAYAIADLIDEKELNRDYIIPSPFNREVASSVAKAVARAAVETGVNRI